MEAHSHDHLVQPQLFDIPLGVPPIVVRIWKAIDQHYANPRNYHALPTRKQLSDILFHDDAVGAYSQATIDRARHDFPEFFPVWPVPPGARPPWVDNAGLRAVAGRELPGLPATLWHDKNWIITDVSLGFLALFGYTSKDQVVGREVGPVIRHHSGPRYPVLKRWTDVAYFADGTPRRMTRVADETSEGGSQTFTLEDPKDGAIFTVGADGRIVDVSHECLALLRYQREQLIGLIPAPLLLRCPTDHAAAARLHGTSDMLDHPARPFWLGDGSMLRLRREVWRATIHSNEPDGFFVHLVEPDSLTDYLGRIVPTLAAVLTTGAVFDSMDGNVDGVVHWCHHLAHIASHVLG